MTESNGSHALVGSYPKSVARTRVAQQIRTLRLARKILVWGEGLMNDPAATVEQRLALAKLILPRAMPALSEQSVSSSSSSVNLTAQVRPGAVAERLKVRFARLEQYLGGVPVEMPTENGDD